MGGSPTQAVTRGPWNSRRGRRTHLLGSSSATERAPKHRAQGVRLAQSHAAGLLPVNFRPMRTSHSYKTGPSLTVCGEMSGSPRKAAPLRHRGASSSASKLDPPQNTPLPPASDSWRKGSGAGEGARRCCRGPRAASPSRAPRESGAGPAPGAGARGPHRSAAPGSRWARAFHPRDPDIRPHF